MQPYLGQICLFAFDFAPTGWALCDGQTLNISSNNALFQLIGTTYGGDGVKTFRLPDLRGRAPICYGQSNSPTYYSIGEQFGSEQCYILHRNLPAHAHQIFADTGTGTQDSPQGNVMANEGNAQYKLYSNTNNAFMYPTGAVGNNVPIDIRQPSIALNYCIAISGTFPPTS